MLKVRSQVRLVALYADFVRLQAFVMFHHLELKVGLEAIILGAAVCSMRKCVLSTTKRCIVAGPGMC